MAAIPWNIIISAIPSLLDAASRLFKKADSPPPSLRQIPDSNADDQIAALTKRLEYLEAMEAEQAKLLKQTIEQLQNISVSCASTAQRTNFALGLSTLTVLTAIIAMIIK